MRRNYVDKILAEVDGVIAPLWMSAFVYFEDLPDLDNLKKSLTELFKETTRLNVVWSKDKAKWVRHEHDDKTIGQILKTYDTPIDIEKICNSPSNLSKDIFLKVHISPSDNIALGKWLYTIQIHHAICDGRSFIYLNSRLWDIYNKNRTISTPLNEKSIGDGRLFLEVIKRLPFIFNLLVSSRRMLSKRAYSLRRDGDFPVEPIFSTIKIPLRKDIERHERSNLFFSALLASIVEHEGSFNNDNPIRLRLPVDLRYFIGKRNTLENADTAIPIEIPLNELRKMMNAPNELYKYVPNKVKRLIFQGVHWATLLEGLVLSRFVSASSLRKLMKSDFSQPVRNNTLVVTYLGTVDKYVKNVPFNIGNIKVHTPTWGANAYTFENNLFINITTFRGIWNDETLNKFMKGMIFWLEKNYDLKGKII